MRLSITPGELSLRGAVDERLCGTFRVTSEVPLSGQDYWSEELNSRSLATYTRSAFNVDLEVLYPSVLVDDSSEICIIAHHPGSYSGVLVYSAEARGVGVGMWLRVLITGEEPSVSVVPFFHSSVDRSAFLVGSLISSAALLLVLLVLILRL